MRTFPLLLLLACGPKDDDDTAPAPDGDERVEATGTVSELVPTVLTVSWTTESEGASWVEYGLDALDQQTPTSPAGTNHAVVVLGLKAGRTYQYRAVTEIGGARVEGDVQEITLDPVPSWYTGFTVTNHDPDRAAMTDGYLLVGISVAIGGGFTDVGSYVAILDGDGDYVWYLDLPPGVGVLTPSVVDGGILWDQYDATVSEDLGTAGHLDIAAAGPITTTRLADGHHAVTRTTPGRYAWIARDIRDVDGTMIQTDRIREGDIGATDADPPTEIFSLFDHFGGAFDYPCSHTLEPHSRDGIPEVLEWTHSNSLIYRPDEDALYLYSRWVDSLFKVDRGTGEVLWTLGGPESDFTFPSGDPVWSSALDSPLWSHGHLSQLWDGGMVLFDNGSHRSPLVSSIAEYAFDEENFTVEEVFRYQDPAGRLMGAVGDVRKLENGNYLSSWTTFGQLAEIGPDSELLWFAASTADYDTARIVYIDDLYGIQ